MAVRVEMPAGCFGFSMQDGTKYSGRPGGHVTVTDEHARAIERTNGGDAGLVQAKYRSFMGTKAGRWCESCRRLWNSWSVACPRCGKDTVPE